MQTADILARLIGFDTTSSKPNIALMTWVQDLLAGAGIAVQVLPDASGGKANLFATIGPGDRPGVMLSGHTDVVPVDGQVWTQPPFVLTLSEGRFYGRGAADMKGSIAAFVAAAARIAPKLGGKGSISLLITGDEEGPAINGTVRMLETLKARGETIGHCLVGEPTSQARLADTLKIGRRGSCTGRLRVIGAQGHVAYPHMAKNPIHDVAPAIAELASTEWDRGNEYFPPTTWQISNFNAGTGANNVIPGTARVQFNFRFSTASTVESLQTQVHGILDKHDLKYNLEWRLDGRPFLTPKGDLVSAISQAIREVAGVETELSTTGGTSDGRFIADICPQVVEFGPTNATIHKVNECLPVAEVEPLERVYRRTLELLLLSR